MVKNAVLSADDLAQMEEGGTISKKNRENRDAEVQNFVDWAKEEKGVEDIGTAEDSKLDQLFSEYMFTLRVNPKVI